MSLNYDDGTSMTSAAFAQGGQKAVKAILMAQPTAAAQAKQVGGIFVNIANDHELKIKSITYGGQVGAAFKPIDILSVAAAIRFTYGTQSMKLKSSYLGMIPQAIGGNGSDKIKYEASAFGVAPVVGVHLRPIDILDFSVQWQGCSYMKYNVDDVSGNIGMAKQLGVEEDKKFHTDIPMAFNFGAGMRVIDPLYVNVGFTYYCNQAATMDSVLAKADYDDSFEISAGADYTINDQWGASFGLCYGNQGQADDVNSVFSPVLDSLTIGCGVEYKPIQPLTITLAGMYSFYFDEDYKIADGVETTLSKKLGIITIGATYKFF